MAIARGVRRRRRAAAAPAADEATRARRPRRRIRLENDQRRAQLLALGVQAFAERTYDEVSVDDIARAAGISKGLLYHYFPTKRDLYLAGLRLTAAELIASTTAAASPALPPLDRMRAGLDAYLDHVSRQARAFVALMRGGIGSDPEVVAVIEGVRLTYVERFLENSEGTPLAGLLLSNRPLVRIAVRGWIGFVEAASLEWLQRQDVERTALRDLLVDALLASLRIGAAGSAPPRT